VAPRSGLTHKHFLDVGAGVIDEDYRGNVGVILFNFGEESYKVRMAVLKPARIVDTCFSFTYGLAWSATGRLLSTLHRILRLD